MRDGEGLVEVDVDHIEAHVAGAHLTQDGVEVAPVVIEQATGVVHPGGNLPDVAVEQAQGARVGEHNAGGPGTEGIAQDGEV